MDPTSASRDCTSRGLRLTAVCEGAVAIEPNRVHAGAIATQNIVSKMIANVHGAGCRYTGTG